MQGKTKDEKYMVSLYQIAKESGDIGNPQDKYTVGQKVGLHPRAVDAICKLLVQANFIRKAGEEDVYMTPHGEKLVKSILGVHD